MNERFFGDCERFFANRNLYKIFNLHETATADDIHRMFIIFSCEFHPDKISVPNISEKQKATAKFQCLNQAYEILKNRNSRKLYDEMLSAAPIYIAPDELMMECRMNYQGVSVFVFSHWLCVNILSFKVPSSRSWPFVQLTWMVANNYRTS